MPEANPNGTGEGQMVAVDEHGTFAFEDVRVDWGDADGDYNDIVFQIKGADGFADSMDESVNSDRDWRTTAVGQELLAYAASTSFNGNTVLFSASNQTTQTISRTSFADSTLTTQEKSSTTTNSNVLTIESDNNYRIFQGKEGRDVLRGGKESDILYGGLGNDRLLGRNNDDMLFGDEGNDLLSGGRGNDILVGGLGNDTLKGGDGSDLFVLAKDGGFDTIQDFEIGQDVIQLSGSLQFEDLTIAQGSGVNRNDVMISIIETNQLLAIVNDNNSEDFTVVDFI